MVKSNSKQIDIKSFKKAEASDMYVVRVYETEGRNADNIELEFSAPITWAKELNGIEEEIGEVKISGNKLIFSTASFRPKTFGVKLAESQHRVSPFKNTCLDINFNGQAFSTDVFLQYANFDLKGNTYAFELLPKELNSEGTVFKFGEMKRNNVLKCNGDTITFTADARNKTLYLLISSTEEDIMAEFDVNGILHRFEVPYYSGFYGQWGGFEQDFKGFIRNAPLAYVGTHRHSQETGNQPYVFTYMYKIAIPLTAASNRIILPKNKNLALFAATLSDANETLMPAAEFRRLSMK
jgi:alpha-mannosidase